MWAPQVGGSFEVSEDLQESKVICILAGRRETQAGLGELSRD